MISIGDKLPSSHLFVMGETQPQKVSTDFLFGEKTCVLFGLPGAFTSVCSSKQVPEYVARKDDFARFGINQIFCLSVNDPYVMTAWAGALVVQPETINFLSDPDAFFTKQIGMQQVIEGLGLRSRRFSALLHDGEVCILNVDEPGGKSYKVSGPDNMLRILREADEQSRS